MSAFFASASTQFLGNATTQILTYPFTVGLWAQATTTGALKTLFTNGSSSVADRFCLIQTVANAWGIFAVTGAGSSSTANAGTVVANQWVYLIGRFINATNRRIAVLTTDGIVSHAQAVFSTSPTPTRMSLGNRWSSIIAEYFDGSIAEFFITNTDIQPDGLQLSDQLLRQLAYAGPFSVPHIANNIVDYRSLRQSLSSNTDNMNEYLGNRGLPNLWANTNGVIIGPHMPFISPDIIGPSNEAQNRMV